MKNLLQKSERLVHKPSDMAFIDIDPVPVDLRFRSEPLSPARKRTKGFMNIIVWLAIVASAAFFSITMYEIHQNSITLQNSVFLPVR